MTDQTVRPDGSVIDEQAARELFDARLAEVRADTSRLSRDKQDWKNLLFYRGGADNQWIAWDGNRWMTKPTSGEGAIPDWVPRAATNQYAKKIDGIAALLDQSQPAQEWGPSTDDDEDRATAEVIEDALPVLRQESGYDDLRPIINKSVALTDKIGVVISYDDDPRHGTEVMQGWRCADPACPQPREYWSPREVDDAGGACPACGGDQVEPAIDAQARPIGPVFPKGRITAELVSSFELSLPPGSRHTNTERLPYVIAHTRYTRDDARRIWGDEAVSRVSSSSRQAAGDTGRQYADAQANLAGPSSSSGQRLSGAGRDDSILVYRFWHDPVTSERYQFPEGLYLVLAEGTVLEAGPLPLQDQDGRPLKPIAIRTFAPVPGTAYGKPPADDLAQLQTQLNLTETLAFMILMHNAAPQTWLPDTVSVLNEIANVPGAINRYKSHQPGDKPVTVPGQGFPPALQWWMERLDAKFEEISGLNAVLGGQRPQGDPTLGEVEMLREQGLGSFKSPIDELVAFEVQVSRLLLMTARQSAWAPRFRKVRGENGEWEISQFTNADLRGKVDVTVDPASAWPKSMLIQQMRIEKAMQMGLLQPDPELQVKLLSKLDLADLKPSLDIDRKQIARELDRWKAAVSPMEIAPPNLSAINVQMHLFYKQQFLKTEGAEAIATQNPPVYQAMQAHLQQLQMAMAPPPQAPAAGPQGTGPAPGGGLDAAIAAGVLKPAGSGAPAEQGGGLDAALASGVLQPAGAAQQAQGPTGPSVDQLLEQGVLTPAPQMPPDRPASPAAGGYPAV